jgi:hypothetical protein
MRFLHAGAEGRESHHSNQGPARSSHGAADWLSPLASADRACCCAAWPVVMAVMPATARRPEPVDLLLCGHHYRASKDALERAGAVIYDSRVILAEASDEIASTAPVS